MNETKHVNESNRPDIEEHSIVAGNADTAQSAMESNQLNLGRKITFPSVVAKEYGAKAAIILKFLAYKIQRSNNREQGKKWFYEDLEDLAARFQGYIPKSTLDDQIKKLVAAGVLHVGRFNRKGYDRTRWYTLDEEWLKACNRKLIQFYEEDARRYGIVEAVLILNICHWIKQHRQKDPDNNLHQVSGAALAKHLPYSKTKINKALCHLVKEGVLKVQESKSTNRAKAYSVVDERRLVASDQSETGGGRESDELDQNSEIEGQKSDNQRRKSETHGRNSDNNTYYKERLVEIFKDTIKKNTLKQNRTCCDFNSEEEDGINSSHDKEAAEFNKAAEAVRQQATQWIESCRKQMAQDPALQICEAHYQRQMKFISPAVHRESDGDLTPNEKVKVLLAWMKARNRVGDLHEADIVPHLGLLNWSQTGLKLARMFFEQNPTVPVSKLVLALDAAIYAKINYGEVEEGEYDNYFCSRRGTSLTFCLRNLARIVTESGLSDDYDDVEFLDKEELDQDNRS